MPDSAELVALLRRGLLAARPRDAELYSRWRALGAVGKADHVLALCRGARICARDAPSTSAAATARCCASCTAAASAAACAAWRSAEAAVAIARERAGDRRGRAATTASTCRSPTERSSSASSRTCSSTCPTRRRCWRRSRACLPRGRRRGAARGELVARGASTSASTPPRWATCSAWTATRRARSSQRAGLAIAGELEDPLPLRVHSVLRRDSRAARGAHGRSGALRDGRSPRARRALARRAFTVHYACLCLPPDA